MTFRIRSFQEADLPKLQEQLEGPYSEQRLLYLHYFNGDFLSWLRERKIEVAVAEDDSGIIGSAAYNDGFLGRRNSVAYRLQLCGSEAIGREAGERS
jgi:hypothetical protein